MTLIKIIIAYYTEKIHRYVFENIYFNNDERKRKRLPIEYTFKEKIILRIYKYSINKCPNFRQILKYPDKKYLRYNIPENLNYETIYRHIK